VTNTSDLIEQQIMKHEAHLKKIDELFEKADEVSDEAADPLLRALKHERDQLEALLSQMRGEAKETWEEAAERHFGPVAVWEALARVLERAIEAHEQREKT
jgi:hypothetical protein